MCIIMDASYIIRLMEGGGVVYLWNENASYLLTKHDTEYALVEKSPTYRAKSGSRLLSKKELRVLLGRILPTRLSMASASSMSKLVLYNRWLVLEGHQLP